MNFLNITFLNVCNQFPQRQNYTASTRRNFFFKGLLQVLDLYNGFQQMKCLCNSNETAKAIPEEVKALGKRKQIDIEHKMSAFLYLVFNELLVTKNPWRKAAFAKFANTITLRNIF